MKKRKNQRPKLLFIIGFLVLLLALTQLVVSHYLATLGGKVRQYERQIAQFEQEKKILEEEISKIGSLSRISSGAERLGFARSTQVVHLTPQIPMALK